MDPLFVGGVVLIVCVAIFAVYRATRDKDNTIEPGTGGGGGGGRGK